MFVSWKVNRGVFLPEIQKVPCRCICRIGLVSRSRPPEPAGVHQTVVVILGKGPEFRRALHRVSLFSPSAYRYPVRRFFNRRYAADPAAGEP